MDIVLSLFYILIFSAIIVVSGWFKLHALTRGQVVLLFLLKVTFGIALTLIYTYHYTDRSKQDIYKYFDDSKPIYGALKKNTVHYVKLVTGIDDNNPALDQYKRQTEHWTHSERSVFSNNRPMIRFNALARLISGGSIYVHTILMCFLSFAGLVAIYKLLIPYFQRRRRELVFCIFLFPSVLFWSSGLLKEGLILFALGITIYSFHKILRQAFGVRHFLALLSGVYILVSLKFYVFAALAPALLGQVLFFRLGKERPFLWHALSLVIIGFLVFLIPRLFPVPSVSELVASKHQQFTELAQQENAGSYIQGQKLKPEIISLVATAPSALVNTILRPFMLSEGGLLQKAIAIENLLVYLLLLLVIVFPRLPDESKGAFTWMGLSFAFVLFLIIGWTTPVMGAIIRYKVPALPFFLASCVQLINKRRLLKWAPFLKRII